MSRLMDNVSTFNSLIRTLLGVAIVAGLGILGYWGYRTFTADDRMEEDFQSQLAKKNEALSVAEQRLKHTSVEFQAKLAAKQQALTDTEHNLTEASQQLDSALADVLKKDEQIQGKDVQIGEQEKMIDVQGQQIVKLTDDNNLLTQKNERLAVSLRLLKVNHRLAQVTVVDVTTDPESGKRKCKIEFVELDAMGKPIAKPRMFEIPGEVFYIDTWLVKFDDKYIESADLERGTSMCLFRRIFGEDQEPSQGFQLDPNGSQPDSYANGGKLSEIEKQIWSNFWEIANNSQETKGLGIRSIHGEAVSKKAVKGKRYIIELRASAGIDFVTTRDVSTER